MAGSPANLFHLENNGILITIDQDLLNHLEMAGTFPLKPQFVARPAPIMGLAGFQGLQPGLFINIGQHQNLAALIILNDGRQQTVTFGKIKFIHDLLILSNDSTALAFRVLFAQLFPLPFLGHKIDYTGFPELTIFLKMGANSIL